MNSAVELQIPLEVDRIPVRIEADPPVQGVALTKHWTDAERRQRARKRVIKIVGTILGLSCIGLFVHILLLIIIPTLIITLAVTAPLYMRLLDEHESWFKLEAKCPHCGKEGLRPFIDTNFRRGQKMTAQCPSCGQNSFFVSDVSTA